MGTGPSIAGDTPVEAIDITGVFPAPPFLLVAARTFVLFIGGLAAALLWATLWIIPVAQMDGGPVLFLVLAIAFGPFVYGAIWMINHSTRWQSGIGSFLTPGDLTSDEQAQPIKALSMTIGALLQRVDAFAASLGRPVVVRASGSKALQAQAMRLGAIVVMLIAIAVGAQGEGYALLPIIAIVGALYTIRRAAQVTQPDVATLLAADHRKPVLLLRSFQDDLVPAGQVFPTPIGRITLGRRFEQGIAGSLGTFGPLIAVGKPGEELPQIGAARAYLSDAEWQPTVLKWIGEAKFIVMIAGATEWIRWELHRIVELGRQPHLFILLPPGADSERWKNIVDSLAHTEWHACLSTLDVRGLLLVRLRPGGAVSTVSRRGKGTVQDYQLAIAIAVLEEFVLPGSGTAA